MNPNYIEITTKSDTLLGSGEGFGAMIDSDIVFDDLGLPYFPARRLKGLLKDSAQEVLQMLELSGIDFTESHIDTLFGTPGSFEVSKLELSNLYISDYPATQEWVKYLLGNHNNIFSVNTVIDHFTTIRHQTALEDGVAKKGSLRTFRVLKPNIKFTGNLSLDENEGDLKLLALACSNLRNVGLMRNRGFGEVKCSLKDSSDENISSELLEALCIK